MNSAWDPFQTAPEHYHTYSANFKQVSGMAQFRIPPMIAEASVPSLSESTQELVDRAEECLPRQDASNDIGGIMEGLLLRTEAINSSRIEGYRTSVRNLFLAAAGARAKAGARETMRNARCLMDILGGGNKAISMPSLLEDHAKIMDGEPFAGQLRREGDSDVFIGGQNILDAAHVPPKPAYVRSLIDDWIRFANRTDIPIAMHIALSHSQFEAIHPFLDGNGRTGRAASQRQLLRRGFRSVPVSAALYGIQQHYYDTFVAYSEGDVEYPVAVHATAFIAAAMSIANHAEDREHLVENWKLKTGAFSPARKNLARAIEWIASTPAFTKKHLIEGTGSTPRTADRIVAVLSEEDIITSGKRTARAPDQTSSSAIWEAREMYELAERVEATARRITENSAPPRYNPKQSP